MDFWVTAYRFLWGVAIVLILIVVVSFFVPKYRALKDYQQRRQDLQAENRRIEAMVLELKQKQERMASDPEFVVRTAKEAGMVGQDEVVFKITNTTPGGATNGSTRMEHL